MSSAHHQQTKPPESTQYAQHKRQGKKNSQKARNNKERDRDAGQPYLYLLPNR
jgi:hypothetical protein